MPDGFAGDPLRGVGITRNVHQVGLFDFGEPRVRVADQQGEAHEQLVVDVFGKQV